MDWDLISTNLPIFLEGMWVTVQVIGMSIILSTLIGYIVAVARRSRFRVLRWVSATYVWIFRGLPLLIGLFFFYYALPQWGLELSAMQAAVGAMTLNSAAFFSEIIRSGLAAVPRGHIEAGIATGMNPVQIGLRIILPETIRLMLPPYINNCVIMLKESAQVAMITVPDLMFEANRSYNSTYSPMETLGLAAVMYLVVSSALMLVQMVVERRLRGRVAAS
ncbi:amino acid ABC transporter permease [Corynebacterium variabile]|uniref:amino acid ABC transporter permease n=1 Tax=Corynebacterium variabile TaxID=1727 RepID=UPI003FD2900B